MGWKYKTKDHQTRVNNVFVKYGFEPTGPSGQGLSPVSSMDEILITYHSY